MPDTLSPRLIAAVRAGCDHLDSEMPECRYPECDCRYRPNFARAVLAAADAVDGRAELVAAVRALLDDYHHFTGPLWHAVRVALAREERRS